MATSSNPFTDIHTSKHFRLGTRKKDVAGVEYIYLAGVASNTAQAWVHIGASYVPVLAVADGQGPMAVSQAANTSATNYSWYAIYGVVPALCLVSFDGTNGAGVWLTATPGSVDDADVAGDAVISAFGLTDRDATPGTASFYLNYPESVDGAID